MLTLELEINELKSRDKSRVKRDAAKKTAGADAPLPRLSNHLQKIEFLGDSHRHSDPAPKPRTRGHMLYLTKKFGRGREYWRSGGLNACGVGQ